MADQAMYTLDTVSLEEIFTELERVAAAFRNALDRQSRIRHSKRLLPESQRIKIKERALNRHLIQNLVPIAKAMPQFSFVHCEPKEMHFCNLREGSFGAHSLGLICLNKHYFDNAIMPSTLSHETAHALGGIVFDEAFATLMGWELDARMVRARHRAHRTSLYRQVRDAIFHASYLKAKSIDQLEEWEREIARIFPRSEFTKKEVEEEVKHFENDEEGLFGHRLSDYTLLPYLAVKNAARTGSMRALIVYAMSDPADTQEVEMPEFMRIWNDLMLS